LLESWAVGLVCSLILGKHLGYIDSTCRVLLRYPRTFILFVRDAQGTNRKG
jgi:hypothetical protein